MQMGAVIIAGGMVGTLLGGGLFRLLQDLGQIDTVISILYVVLLGTIGVLMAKEAATALDIIKPRRTRQARAAAPQSADRDRCRCAGASTARASTSRRSRLCCSASWPAC